ncbi:MAG: tetratricopeptide repeat protein [Candidatus Eiseniibacteriota bacterium]|nr:MAG: tetratricopeptide repeat protein [Candidatus Eisenbacteria bacterium]
MEKKGEAISLRGGGLHVVLDMMNEVERVVREELEIHPDFPDLHNRLGLIQFRREDFEGARTSFEAALSVNPDYFVAGQNLAFCLTEKGRLGEAESVFSRGLEGEGRALALNAVALLRLKEGRFEEAEEKLREAASNDPRSALYPHNLAMASFLRGKPDDAARNLREAEKLCPPYSEFFGEALLFAEGRVSEEAFKEYLRQQEVNPHLSELHDHLGHAYSANGMFSEAEQEYRLSLRTFPSLGNYYGNLALLYSAQDREQEVLLYHLKAVDAEPNSVKARAALAFEYSARGLAVEATKQFEAARALRPNYADIRYNLGLLYLELERTDDAMEELRAALEANPDYLFARNSLALVLFRRGDLDEALNEYEKVVSSGLCSSDILVNMGIACREKQALDRALEHLKNAICLNPEYAPAYYHLGVTYQAKAQKEKARWAWKAYLEHAQEDAELEEVRKAMEKE